MTEFEIKLKSKIIAELEKAENIYNDVKEDLVEKSLAFSQMNESVQETKIPGFKLIKGGKGEVGDFIAFVLDIRNSTKNLTQSISSKISKVSQLERVFYETTAINTCGIELINKYNGGITEFLGDGFLALFSANEKKDVHKAHNAANDFVKYLNTVINPVLNERYNLPELKIGIGLAYGKAIVTLIGNNDDTHPKAIGECVFRASKLSTGINEILIDDKLRFFWPKSEGGKLKFNEINIKDQAFKGYKIKENTADKTH